MFIKNKEIMNKSAVFRLKLSFPNVSGLALHQSGAPNEHIVQNHLALLNVF